MERRLRGCMPCLGELWDCLWPPPVTPNTPPSRPEIAVISGPFQQSKLPQLTPTPLLAPKSEPLYTALYDFQARSPEELSLKKGERLRVIRDEGEYLFAQKTGGSGVPGAEGLVPTNYVKAPEKFAHQPWYFGSISRTNAEKLLQSAENQIGTFLVRKSETGNNDYSISALNDKVYHFRIFTSSEGKFYLHENQTFATVSELLEFYKRDGRILGFSLTNPHAKQNVYKADEWERPKEEFTLLRKLGEGHFGEVWEGVWNENQHVAIKMLKKDDMIEDEFVKEVKAMKNINHPKLIQLFAICSLEEPIYIVTELMSKGNLQEYLRGAEGETLTMAHHVYLASQVAEGMAYLEHRGFVHRDLAARNVLVGEELVCKVADFGLARLIRDDVYHVRAGTKIPVKWTAPEAANYQRYTVKSDVWSFGVLLYEIVTYGKDPYEGMTNKEVVNQVNNGYRMPCPKNCTPDMYGIMLRCWNESEESRPSFSTLLDELNSLYATYYYKSQNQTQ